jgi:glutathione synthase/RimK-type ligase-like ATP-grasp enzyme
VAPCSPEGAINWRIRDVSKRRVNEVFDRVFPYSLSVNPETYTGKCVEKVDENGLHAGQVVQCPHERRNGFVYQRLVDNRKGHSVEDIRAVIVGNEIPVVYVKRRPIHDRFSNMNSSVDLVSSPFRGEEASMILSFCSEMGLDYGELDVLRDNEDGRIYVVDVNKTTFGPPNHLPLPKRFKAIELIALAFERQFLSGQPEPTRKSALYATSGQTLALEML